MDRGHAQRRSSARRVDADASRDPQDLRQLYRTAWELPQKALIDLAAARGPFIDQSQSLNLFMATPTIGKLSSMYAYAWKKRPEDHLLPALASRDPHSPDDDSVQRCDQRRVGRRRSRARSRTPRAAKRASSRPRTDLENPPIPPELTCDPPTERPVHDAARPRFRPDAAPDEATRSSTRCTGTPSRTPGPSRRSTSRRTLVDLEQAADAGREGT